GANATVMHYVANDRPLAADTLVLVDAGARKDMYCADITRTFPVSGKFSSPQRALYDAVLAARAAAIAAVTPGAAFADVHTRALVALVDAMIEHKLLSGTRAELLEQEDKVKQFFPHKTSHWLGLDVHDVGDYVRAGAARKLQPGMVLTVEPGLYV